MAARWFRIVNGVVALLFAASAALQYNDPDPLGWILVYAAAALACLQTDRLRADWVFPLAVLLAAVLWLGYLGPDLLDRARLGDVVRSMDDPGASAELAREAGGLVIVATWMLLLVLRSRLRS